MRLKRAEPESEAGDVGLVINGLPLANLAAGLGIYTFRLILGLLRLEPNLSFRVVVPAHFQVPEIPEHLLVRLCGPRTMVRPLFHTIYWSARIVRYARYLPSKTLFHSPAPIAGFGGGLRTIVTIHDCLYRTFPQYYGRSGVRKLFLHASERYAARSTLVFTQSEFSRAELARQTAIPAEKVRVLSPWVDEPFLAHRDPELVNEVRARLRLPERFWLYVGGYDCRKNVEFLIDCYALARRQLPLPPLALAGRIPLPDEAVTTDVRGALRRAGLREPDVLLPGFIAVADLPQLYRAASLVIYPSLMEGFGLPAAEAMAVGTPVLASNTSSLPEVIGKSECLFDPIDHQSLVARMLSAGESELKFHAKLSEMFTERYGVERYLRLTREAKEMIHRRDRA